MVVLGEICATKNCIVRIGNLKIHDCYSVKIYNQFEIHDDTEYQTIALRPQEALGA